MFCHGIVLLAALHHPFAWAESASTAPLTNPPAPAGEAIAGSSSGKNEAAQVKAARVTGAVSIVIALLGTLSAVLSERRAAVREDRVEKLKADLDLRKAVEVEHQKVIQDLQSDIDKDIRTQRLQHYQKLWGLMINLPKYPEPAVLDSQSLKTLSGLLRNWYFEGGGLVMSWKTRDKYFDLQDACKIALEKTAEKWKDASELATKADALDSAVNILLEPRASEFLITRLDRGASWRNAIPMPIARLALLPSEKFQEGGLLVPGVVEQLRKLGSDLRQSMTEDVLTRRVSLLERNFSCQRPPATPEA